MLFFGLTGTAPAFSRVVLGVDVSIYLALLNLAVFTTLWLPIAIEVWPHLSAIPRAAAVQLRRSVGQYNSKSSVKAAPESIHR